MTFEKLGLSENILKAINECGYDKPTPIQDQAIPVILMARDVVGVAQTGTGKTASFTLPMIEILAGGRAKARMPRSLILSPTRELAAQIAENFDLYGKHCKLEKALLGGGVSVHGPHLVRATLGFLGPFLRAVSTAPSVVLNVSVRRITRHWWNGVVVYT